MSFYRHIIISSFHDHDSYANGKSVLNITNSRFAHHCFSLSDGIKSVAALISVVRHGKIQKCIFSKENGSDRHVSEGRTCLQIFFLSLFYVFDSRKTMTWKTLLNTNRTN